MTEEKKKFDIDWKEFSRKLLFEGMVPALTMITDETENKIDDGVMTITEKVGHLFLDKPEV